MSAHSSIAEKTLIGAQRWAVLLMAISGFAALGYQMVWIQQNAQWLGHEAPAMLAIVSPPGADSRPANGRRGW